jgi:hypothetical protein
MSLSRLGFARRLMGRQFRDTSIILTRGGAGRNVYGYKGADYTPGQAQVCAFDSTASGEIAGSTTQTGTISARVFFPLDTLIRTQDRVQLTHRNGDGTAGTGEALATPLVFDVVGPPQVEPTCIAVQLVAVIEGSGT